MDENKFIKIKPCTLSELASLYGVSRPTMRKWISPFLKEIGQRQGYIYSILQVRIIFEKLGEPGDF